MVRFHFVVSDFFRNQSNIDQRLGKPEGHAGFSIAPVWQLSAPESFTLPPDLKVECHDRLPRCDPTACHSATSLPEMPDAHDACAHRAGTYRIRASHLRLLQMQPCRKTRYRVGSDEVRRCRLARWRIATADVNVTPPLNADTANPRTPSGNPDTGATWRDVSEPQGVSRPSHT
jgi:hypothetical protein